MKGAITTPTPGDIVGACFGNLSAASATNPAFTSIRRNPLTGGLDGDPSIAPGLFGALTNQGLLRTDGIDVALSYRMPLTFLDGVYEGTKLALSLTGNYTFNSEFQANAADTTFAGRPRECTGYFSANCASIQPKFQWSQRTTLTFGDIDVSLLWRHIDGVDYETRQAVDDGQGLFVGTAPAWRQRLLRRQAVRLQPHQGV